MLPRDEFHAITGRRLLPVIVALLILGCASQPAGSPTTAPAPAASAAASGTPATPAPSTPPAEDSVPEVPITGALLYQWRAAELAAQQGERGAAYALYLKLARETRDPRLARRAAELALQGRALAQSIEAAELWRALAPNSREANQTLALLYASSGRYADAFPLYEAEVKAAASPAVELARIPRT